MLDERDVTVSLSGLAPASTLASSLATSAFTKAADGSADSPEPSPLRRWRSMHAEPKGLSVCWFIRVSIAMICSPLILLVILSLGSGWAFPNLLPDRMDGAPWRLSFAGRDCLVRAAMTSAWLSVFTAFLSTTAGFLLARRIRNRMDAMVIYLLYMPFVVSPVVAGVCLYDLIIRIGLAGSAVGVLLVQCVFATSFSAIYFREAISQRLERTENLIRTLGGNSLAIWRHAIWPQCRGLIVICLIQTALYSWLDYGLVSVIGGGNVVPLTVSLFGYIREASTNLAALASLLLMVPAILGLLLTFARVFLNRRDERAERRPTAAPGDLS